MQVGRSTKRISVTDAIMMNQDVLYGERLKDGRKSNRSGGEGFKTIFEEAVLTVSEQGVGNGKRI